MVNGLANQLLYCMWIVYDLSRPHTSLMRVWEGSCQPIIEQCSTTILTAGTWWYVNEPNTDTLLLVGSDTT